MKLFINNVNIFKIGRTNDDTILITLRHEVVWSSTQLLKAIAKIILNRWSWNGGLSILPSITTKEFSSQHLHNFSIHLHLKSIV